MPVTAIFALGAPGGSPSVLTLQPTIIIPLWAPRVGTRASGVVQHGLNAIRVGWTEGFEGPSIILDTEIAELFTQYTASNSTAGERSIAYWKTETGASSGTVKCLMDAPTYELGATGVYRAVWCLFRDLGRP